MMGMLIKKKKKMLKRIEEKDERCLQLRERVLPYFLLFFLPFFFWYFWWEKKEKKRKSRGIGSLDVLRIRLLDSVFCNLI